MIQIGQKLKGKLKDLNGSAYSSIQNRVREALASCSQNFSSGAFDAAGREAKCLLFMEKN